MSTARDEILAKIRTTRAAPLAAPNRLGSAEQRLQEPAANLIPARGQTPAKDRLAQFIAEAERVNASVARVANDGSIPAEIARYLADNNLPSRLKHAPSLAHLDWSETLLDVQQGIGAADDEVCVTTAFAGVSETGTLVTYSGAENPTTLNYLPPVHIAVLRAADISASYEAVWQRLRENKIKEDQSSGFIPRTVNMITGPSRTADIEQTLLLGIHGPQRLHIVIIDDEEG